MDCYNTDSVGGGAVCAFGLVVLEGLCAGFDSVELVSFLGWVSLHGLAISVGGGMVVGWWFGCSWNSGFALFRSFLVGLV